MQTLTQILIDQNYTDRVITHTQLKHIVDGTEQRRHHLVNRALKANELIQIIRGVYVLADKYKSHSPHPFHVAQNLMPGSYVSLESALAFHGWIPEAVYETASITRGRKYKEFDTEQFGQFSFHPLALHTGFYLELVTQEKINSQSVLIAKPLRALMDLVCKNKISWQGLDWLVKGLRIDMEYLETISSHDVLILKYVYKHKKAVDFLSSLAEALNLTMNYSKNDLVLKPTVATC